MTTPTLKELAERLRNLRAHYLESVRADILDIAAAIEAMPERDEWRRRFEKEIEKTLADLCQERGHAFEARNREQENFVARLQLYVRNLYEKVTGTPWTPPAPERVSDEELEDARNYYFDLSEPGYRGSPKETVKRLIEAERERRRGVK